MWPHCRSVWPHCGPPSATAHLPSASCSSREAPLSSSRATPSSQSTDAASMSALLPLGAQVSGTAPAASSCRVAASAAGVACPAQASCIAFSTCRARQRGGMPVRKRPLPSEPTSNAACRRNRASRAAPSAPRPCRPPPPAGWASAAWNRAPGRPLGAWKPAGRPPSARRSAQQPTRRAVRHPTATAGAVERRSPAGHRKLRRCAAAASCMASNPAAAPLFQAASLADGARQPPTHLHRAVKR